MPRTVASSVQGLTSDHVTIVDDAGRTLSEGDEQGSVASMTSRQLSVQLEVEKNLRDKAERLLAPVLGAGNARVQVNATLSFDRVERSSQTVDPDKQAVSQEQKTEIIPGEGPGAASVATSASYVQSIANESISSAIGALQRLSVAVLLATPAPAGPSEGAGPAVATIDSTALREQVETLVKSAVGFDQARGDVVTVTMLPFTPKTVLPATAPPSTFEQLQSVQRPALSALGILLAFVIALLTLRAAGKTSESVTQLAAAGAPAGYFPDANGNPAAFAAQYQQQYAAGGGPGMPQMAPPRAAPMISIPNNPMREQVLASVEQQPEVAAKLMRAWLRDG
jgi:flagellar M-ring protein FliF